MNLAETISDDLMVTIFIQGTPNRPRLTAFDEIVSRVSLIVSEFKRERDNDAEVMKDIPPK